MPSNVPAVCAMAVTPFAKNGGIDAAATRRQVRFLSDRGVGIFLAAPGAGDGRSLTREERVARYQAAAKELGGKAALVAGGIENQTTPWTVEWVKLAIDNGCDSVQLYGPEHADPVSASFERDMERELRIVLDSITTPVLLSLYSHNRTALIPQPVAQRLVESYPHLQGLTLGRRYDAAYMRSMVDSLGKRVEVRMAAPGLLDQVAAGVTGFLGYEPTIAPKRYAAIVGKAKAGDRAGAEALLNEFQPLQAIITRHMQDGSLPLTRALKLVLNALDLNVGDARGAGVIPPTLAREITLALAPLKAFEQN